MAGTCGTTAGDMTSSSSASATVLERGLRLAAAGATAALSDDAAALLAAGLLPAGPLYMQAILAPKPEGFPDTRSLTTHASSFNC